MMGWRRLQRWWHAWWQARAPRDPRAVEQALAQVEDEMAAARTAIADCDAQLTRLHTRMAGAREVAHRYEEDARLALTRGNERLAREAVRRGLQAEAAQARCQRQCAAYATHLETLRQALQALELQQARLGASHESLLAHQQLAQARDALRALQRHPGLRMLSEADETHGQEMAALEAYTSLTEAGLGDRIDALPAVSLEEVIETRLRALYPESRKSLQNHNENKDK